MRINQLDSRGVQKVPRKPERAEHAHWQPALSLWRLCAGVVNCARAPRWFFDAGGGQIAGSLDHGCWADGEHLWSGRCGVFALRDVQDGLLTSFSPEWTPGPFLPPLRRVCSICGADERWIRVNFTPNSPCLPHTHSRVRGQLR